MAKATTRNRYFRLDPMIKRNMLKMPLRGPFSSEVNAVANFELGTEQLDGSIRHHRGSDRGPVRKDRQVTFDVVDLDIVANEDQGLRVRVHRVPAVRFVDHRREGHGQSLLAVAGQL